MTKEKQIEEMAKVIRGYARDYDDDIYGCEDHLARYLTEAGYRKASEIAREIFEEIDKGLDEVTILMGRLDSLRTFHKTMEAVTAKVEELKKKYTESEKDNG